MTQVRLALWGRDVQVFAPGAETIVKALDTAGIQTDPVACWNDPSETGQGLPRLDGTQACLLLVETAQDALGRALDDGLLPSQGIRRWKQDCKTLLTLFRQRRRVLTLISVQQALAHPQAFVSALSPRLGFKAVIDPDDIAAAARIPTPPAPWKMILAHQTISQDAEAMRLNGELEAAMLPLGASSVDPDAAFSDICALEISGAALRDDLLRLNETMTTQHNAHTRKEEALHTRLSDVQEALERSESTAQKRKLEFQGEQGLLSAQFKAVQEEMAALFAENMRNAKIIEALGQDLEGQRCKTEDLSVELAQLQALRKQHEARIAEFQSSTSWKVTAPIRRLKRSFSSKHERDSLQ